MKMNAASPRLDSSDRLPAAGPPRTQSPATPDPPAPSLGEAGLAAWWPSGKLGHQLGLCAPEQRSGSPGDKLGHVHRRLLPREAMAGRGQATRSRRHPSLPQAREMTPRPNLPPGPQKARSTHSEPPQGEGKALKREAGGDQIPRPPECPWLPVPPEPPAMGPARLHLGQARSWRERPRSPSARLARRSRND